MKKSLKVLFFGNERIATGISTEPSIFKALLDGPHDVVGLVVHTSDSTSRAKLREPIVEYAESRAVRVINPSNLNSSLEEIKNFGADIGILVAYGKIIPKSVIDLFPLGIINLHPSMLPMLRGSAPLETTIMEGRDSTGVTIMKLATEMDAGPILAQKEVAISTQLTKQQLADKLHREGMELLLNTLDKLAEGQVVETPQDESAATFCSIIKKADGLIDFSKSAVAIERQIRAYSGWPSSYFENNTLRYVVNTAEVTNDEVSKTPGTVVIGEKTLGIQTAEGVVWVTSIQPAGKKEMPIQAFLNGYKSKLIYQPTEAN